MKKRLKPDISKEKMISPNNIISTEIDNAEEDYEEIYQKVQKVYLADNRPWVIGYSEIGRAHV